MKIFSYCLLTACIVLFSACDGKVHLDKGKRYMDAGMYERATAEFRRVIRDHPKSEFRDEARRLLKECKALAQAENIKTVADSLYEKGSYDAALEQYEKILILLIRAGSNRTEQVRKRIENLQSRRLDNLVEKGDLYLQEGLYMSALEVYEKAWSISSKDPGSRLASKINELEGRIIIAALEQMIKEAEKDVEVVERKPERKTAQAREIDIIKGPGSKRTKSEQKVELGDLYALKDKMKSGDLSEEEEQQIYEYVTGMGFMGQSSQKSFSHINN